MNTSQFPTAFDAIAQDYDAAFTNTAVGKLQRQLVWDFLERLRLTTQSSDEYGKPKVLELNCGTGEDACWLARQGCSVLATDASAEMVAVAGEKARIGGLPIETRVCGFADLEALPEGDFDLVLSNFGGLNCLSPEGLSALGQAVFQKLRPGGRFVAVVMGRFCLWETLYFLLKGKLREAFRRRAKGPVAARLDERTVVATWYYSPVELLRLLGGNSTSIGGHDGALRCPVGFWLPPSYLNPFFQNYPRLLRALYFLEKKCRGHRWAQGADHFLLSVEKTTTESSTTTGFLSST